MEPRCFTFGLTFMIAPMRNAALARKADQKPTATKTSESSPALSSLISTWATFSMQKKKNRRFLFLRSSSSAWETLQANTLLLSFKKTDLLPQSREKISFVSRFPSVLFGSSKPFRRNFGMTHGIDLHNFLNVSNRHSSGNATLQYRYRLATRTSYHCLH